MRIFEVCRTKQSVARVFGCQPTQSKEEEIELSINRDTLSQAGNAQQQIVKRYPVRSSEGIRGFLGGTEGWKFR
jgi:hypothetical protein